ncbi:hypothetical protein NDU88_006766 [Pleurodeles waltl]|uniref:Uncharacterized protein n=1 Tax=Pleurodeles waltl TaxID=8319 RepID=A0AAV7VQ22_PLEWA|nr:hypothetical protein NDU88_006766 [Pleurodeles waltl]
MDERAGNAADRVRNGRADVRVGGLVVEQGVTQPMQLFPIVVVPEQLIPLPLPPWHSLLGGGLDAMLTSTQDTASTRSTQVEHSGASVMAAWGCAAGLGSQTEHRAPPPVSSCTGWSSSIPSPPCSRRCLRPVPRSALSTRCLSRACCAPRLQISFPRLGGLGCRVLAPL